MYVSKRILCKHLRLYIGFFSFFFLEKSTLRFYEMISRVLYKCDNKSISF